MMLFVHTDTHTIKGAFIDEWKFEFVLARACFGGWLSAKIGNYCRRIMNSKLYSSQFTEREVF
jgi:hypothetical protein